MSAIAIYETYFCTIVYMKQFLFLNSMKDLFSCFYLRRKPSGQVLVPVVVVVVDAVVVGGGMYFLRT